MSLVDLTPAVDALLRPWARRLAAQGYTAGMMTLAGTGLCLAIGGLVTAMEARWYVVALVVPALGFRLVALRLHALLVQELARGSLLARLLDEVCRPLSEVALFWPLSRMAGLDGTLVTVCCLLTLLTELAGLAVLTIGTERRRDGPMDGASRTLTLAGLCLLLGVGIGPGWWTSVWLQVLPFLLAWTLVRRLQGGLRQVQVGETADRPDG